MIHRISVKHLVGVVIVLYLLMLQRTLFAQSNYSFSVSSETYATISGTNVDLSSQSLSSPIDIGFTFNFDGVDYTQIVADRRGWLSFNLASTSSMSSTWSNGNLADAPMRPLIAPLYYDNGISYHSGATARYTVTGTAPNRIFTFEWYDWTFHWYTNNDVCFQVKLYETSNKIECLYLPMASCYQYEVEPSIGLAFVNTGDFLSVTDFSDDAVASSEFESHNFPGMPVANRKYTFEPITPKTTPSNQCTNFAASSIADNFVLTWTDATGSTIPDGYLIMASTNNTFPDPIDETWISHDNDLSDGTGIVKVLQGKQFYNGWKNAQSQTNYYFKIYAYTNSGTLIKYNTLSAPETQLSILKSQPTSHVTNFRIEMVNGKFLLKWTDAHQFGNAIDLNYNMVYPNSCSYIDCGNNSSLDITGNTITLEAWVNPSKNDGSIIQKENSTLDGGYQIYLNNKGQLCFGLYIDGSWSEVVTDPFVLPYNSWSHICGTYDGTTQSIYISGILIASKACSGNITTSSSNLFIGRNHITNFVTFDGQIDEIAIWSTARTQAQIVNDLNLKLTGTETGLAAYYKCNQNVNDATSNANNATLMNGASYTSSNLSSEIEGYVIQTSTTDSFIAIENGTDITIDDDLSDNVGAIKVAQGTQYDSSWVNINSTKPYYFRIIPYSGNGTEIVYNTEDPIPTLSVMPEPTNHVTNFLANAANCNIELSWTDATGDQVPDGYVILASTTGSFTTPTDGTPLSNDNDLSDNSGVINVSKGGQNYSQWTGFVSGTTYYFAIYPYSSSGTTINYKTDGDIPQASGSIIIYPEASNQANGFSASNNGSITLNWNDAQGINITSTNNALNFDGSSDFVTCGAQNPSVFTLEALVNPSVVSSDQAIISTLNESSSTGMELHINTSGNPVLTIRSASGWLDLNSAITLTTNTWVHIAASYDGSIAKLYVNGVLTTQLSSSSYSQGTSTLLIGRRSSGGYFFNGTIDEVRVWNTALSADEINSSKNIELAGTESGLLSYYQFNQGTAEGSNTDLSTLIDAKGNYNGTLQTFALTGSASNWVSGAQAPQGYLIMASTSDSFADPIDGTDIATDNDLSDGTAVIKVNQGEQSYSGFIGENGLTTYYFKMWSYSNSGNYINYNTTATAPTASLTYTKTKPITHVTELSASNDNKKIYLQWTDATEGIPSFGNAISLDGINDYISIPALGSDLSTVTIESWINLNSSSAAGLFNTNSFTTKDLHLQIWNNSTIEFAIGGTSPSSPFPQATYPFVLNKWYHVAVSYNYSSKQVKFYVNGALIKTVTLTTAQYVNLTAAQIGAYTTSRNFTGKIDEYRLWNTERTQSEIFNNMYSELSGTESGLLAYYKFNQGTAEGDNTGITTVTDASSNAKNGTLVNLSLSGTNSNWVSTGDIGYRISAPDGYLVKASKSNVFTDPINGTAETDDNDLTDGSGTINVLKGIQSYNDWQNFTDTTAYYYKVYPYSNSGTSIIYNTNPTVPTVKDSVGIDEFKEITTIISGLVQGKARWADYDNDGDMDLLVFGGNIINVQGNITNCLTKLYQQDAHHNFTEVSAGFIDVADGDAAWGDYNNDGLLDLIITGASVYDIAGNSSSPVTKLYMQNSDHTFTLQSSVSFTGLLKSSIAWGDYDNDGDLDVLMSGKELVSGTTFSPYAKIYRNNGDNTFTPQYQISFNAIYDGSVAWGDYNNDGYLDILMSGRSNNGLVTEIYTNNQNNYFFKQKNFNITGIEYGASTWGDFDNDGDLDILINGSSSSGVITTIFKNNYPDNSFTELENLNISKIYNGLAQWGDINKDGKLDIIISGSEDGASVSYITQIYFQNDDNTFSIYSGSNFKNGSKGALSLIDFDHDNDLDVFMTGYNTYSGSISSGLYQNNYLIAVNNPKPIAPVSLVRNAAQEKSILSWDRVTTDNTPSSGLSYNLRVGTTSGGMDIVSPMSDISTTSGYNRTGLIGNCQQNNFKILKLAPGKTYYWSVQAVDNSYAGGNFSAESSFFVDSIPASGLTFSRISDTEYKAKWTRGNGNRCAVFCRADSSSNDALPIMGQKYVYNSRFTYGDPIPSTDWFCVYNGIEDSVTISGLSANTTFTLQVIEYVFDASGNPIYFRQSSPDNDDWGVFNTDSYVDLPGLGVELGAKRQWADFNNDGYIDYVCTSSNSGETQFYVAFNNGDHTFTKKHLFEPSINYNQFFFVADFDNDGYQEIVFTGQKYSIGSSNSASDFTSLIYHYNTVTNDLTFTSNVVNIPTMIIYTNNSYLVDYNNDGYIDIEVIGEFYNENSKQESFNQIFYNNHDNTFTAGETDLSIPEVYSIVGNADFDNDGDIDRFSNLQVEQNNEITIPGSFNPNKKPTTPSSLTSKSLEGNMMLNWSNENTDETPDSSMTYDIRIRKVGNSDWIDNPLIAENGYRRVVTLGKYTTNSATLSLELGSYEWQVQAIDQGYQSSAWSTLNTFTTSSFYTADTVCLGDSTTFTDHSAMLEGEATWLWDFGDNTFSTLKNPKHLFSTPGKHYVSLSVNSYVYSDTVFVNDTIPISFTASDVCTGLASTIKNTIPSVGLVNWEWDFGDNSPVSTTGDSIFVHGFPTLGNYKITLTATGSNGCSAKAIHNVVVTTTPSAVLTLEYGSPTFCSGDSVVYSVPSDSNYSYQWQLNSENISNTTNQLTVKTLSGNYQVIVTNKLASTCMDVSALKAITVNETPASPVITAESATTFCQGDSVKLNLGALSNITVNWYKNGGNLLENQLYYTTKEPGLYTAKVTNSVGCSNISKDPVSIVVNEVPALPSLSYGSTTVCSGTSVVFSTINVSGLNYQWKNNGASIIGATTNQYTATASGNYSLQLTNSNACWTETPEIAVTVNPVPVAPIIDQPYITSLCSGDSVLLRITEVPDITYQWYLNNGTVGSNSKEFYAKASGTYQVALSNSFNCSSISTNSISIVVNNKPDLPSVSYGSTTICQGNSVIFNTNSVSGLNYQWKNDGANISGATTSQYSATSSGSYSLQITNSSLCSVETPEVTVTVNSIPTSPIIDQPSTNSFCNGDSILLQTIYQDGIDWLVNGISSGINSNIIYAKTGGKYSVKVTNTNLCEAISTNFVDLTMNQLPTLPTVSTGETSICEGNSVNFLVDNNPLVTYQWYKNNEPITNATSNTLSTGTAGNYWLRITNSSLCSISTSPINVTVNDVPSKPTIIEANNNTSFCPGTEVELQVTNSIPELTYQWKRSGIAISGATQSNYAGQLIAGDYNVEVKAGGCANESEILTLNTKAAPPKPQIYAKGPNVWILACDNTTASDYRWFYEDQLIVGAKTYIYTANQSLGNYYVEVNDGGECYTMSDIINIPTGDIINDITDLASESITVYPNPTTDQFNVELGGILPGVLYVDLADALGKTIKRYQYQDVGNFYINISELPRGIYFCRMQYKSSVIVKKIVKQ
ncbi:MAG: LamG-like jellyroll fold domain-containing protein [Bacteroidales bacterium]